MSARSGGRQSPKHRPVRRPWVWRQLPVGLATTVCSSLSQIAVLPTSARPGLQSSLPGTAGSTGLLAHAEPRVPSHHPAGHVHRQVRAFEPGANDRCRRGRTWAGLPPLARLPIRHSHRSLPGGRPPNQRGTRRRRVGRPPDSGHLRSGSETRSRPPRPTGGSLQVGVI
jgi:hypothetical protein